MSIRLNHIGLVVTDIDEFTGILLALKLRAVTQPESDPVMKVKACFISTGNDEDCHIELLEPTDSSSPIAGFLSKHGGGLHHLCFEVDDIDTATKELEAQGYKVLYRPLDCVGYDRSFGLGEESPTKIAFFMTPKKLLVELLQKGK